MDGYVKIITRCSCCCALCFYLMRDICNLRLNLN
uniref:Uncharacterized protein n=1 Tax=Anguilla anguilla TaxID=7936 RepID=A0A0E9Q447_ANGAN